MQVYRRDATQPISTQLNPTQLDMYWLTTQLNSTQLNWTDSCGFQPVLDSRDPVVTQLEQMPVNHREERNN